MIKRKRLVTTATESEFDLRDVFDVAYYGPAFFGTPKFVFVPPCKDTLIPTSTTIRVAVFWQWQARDASIVIRNITTQISPVLQK